MNVSKRLRVFFEEKDVPYQQWKIKAGEEIHFIDNEVIIDTILNSTPEEEQKEIMNMLVNIDFYNGNVNHFLHYLAESMIVRQYQTM